MDNFTASEYTDMIITYGMAGENGCAAERLYAERFPGRERHPSRHVILRCVQRLRETGSVCARRDAMIPRIHVHHQDIILREFRRNPGTSVRRASAALGCSRYLVHRTLRDSGMHPYHFQRVQQLLPRDEGPRIFFCEGIFVIHISALMIFLAC